MGSGEARFRRGEKLLDARDFQRVARRGRRAASGHFVVLTWRRSEGRGSEVNWPRIGITASRRVGSAVRRNRAKRLIREWFRGVKARLSGDLDILVIARVGAGELGLTEARGELCRLLAEAAR